MYIIIKRTGSVQGSELEGKAMWLSKPASGDYSAFNCRQAGHLGVPQLRSDSGNVNIGGDVMYIGKGTGFVETSET